MTVPYYRPLLRFQYGGGGAYFQIARWESLKHHHLAKLAYEIPAGTLVYHALPLCLLPASGQTYMGLPLGVQACTHASPNYLVNLEHEAVPARVSNQPSIKFIVLGLGRGPSG